MKLTRLGNRRAKRNQTWAAVCAGLFGGRSETGARPDSEAHLDTETRDGAEARAGAE